MLKNILFKVYIPLTLISCSNKQINLPFIGKHDVSNSDTIYHTIPNFNLINQDNKVITQDNLNNKIYVAGFFFTSCPGTCPIIIKQLIRLQEMTQNNDDFEIVTYSVDTKRDNPKRLRRYIKKFDIDLHNWTFLTDSNDKAIYKLGMEGYYLSMGRDDSSPGGFLHSSKLVLVDKNKNIRGLYDGTKANEVNSLYKDIQILSSL